MLQECQRCLTVARWPGPGLKTDYADHLFMHAMTPDISGVTGPAETARILPGFMF